MAGFAIYDEISLFYADFETIGQYFTTSLQLLRSIPI